jgi:elongation factor P
VEAKAMQFLYDDGDFFVFMDNDTYDQINIPTESVGAGKNFLTGGMNVDLLFDGSEVLDIRLPSHVILEVTETEPGFKGNTATGANKPATVETGFTLNVPLFIEEGDKLRIDTRTGDYVERSKE